MGLGLFCVFLPRGAQEFLKSSALSILSPVLSPMRDVSDAARSRLGRWLDVGPDARLRAQRDALMALLVEREDEALSLHRQLRGATELKERIRTALRAVPARVIGCDAVQSRRSLVLDKGGLDGIRSGQAVTSGASLLGRVTSVGRDACRVQCVNDPESRIWVLIGAGSADRPDAGRIQGVAQGSGTAGLRLLLCGRPEAVRAGDPVVTSGYDERYPAGLLIGRVSHVEAEGSVSAVVTILPASDLESVEEAQVLTSAGGEG